MRRAWLLPVAAAVIAINLAGQETSAPQGREHAQAGHGPAHVDLWKLANFALFIAAAGYLLRRRAGEFFRRRSEGIQQDIAQAARYYEQATAQCKAIEQRLANVEIEIEQLRQQAKQEVAAERERLLHQLQREAAKIQSDAEQEIQSLVKLARQRLREEAASLAVSLASGLIRQRLTPEDEDRLIHAVARDLEGRRPGMG